MVALGQFAGELGRRVHRRIDFPSQLVLRATGELGDFGERDRADHAHVHVAIGMRFAAGHGAVEKRHTNPVGQRVERRLQDPGHARRLQDEPAQLSKHGAFGVGLKEHLGAAAPTPDYPGLLQPFQFALHGPAAGADGPQYLAHIEGLIRVTEEQSEHGAARATEQGCRKRVVYEVRTHSGDDRTRFGPARQADGLSQRAQYARPPDPVPRAQTVRLVAKGRPL